MKKKLLIGGLMILMLGGIGFTAMGGMRWVDGLGLRGAEPLVRSRMTAYWEARMANDVERMAEYVHPAQPLVVQPGTLVTESYEIQDLKVDGDKAVAVTKIKTRLKHAMFSSKSREVTIQDTWVRFNDKWYQEPSPISIGDAIKKMKGTWVAPGSAAAQGADAKSGAAGAKAQAEPVEGGNGSEGGGAGI